MKACNTCRSRQIRPKSKSFQNITQCDHLHLYRLQLRSLIVFCIFAYTTYETTVQAFSPSITTRSSRVTLSSSMSSPTSKSTTLSFCNGLGNRELTTALHMARKTTNAPGGKKKKKNSKNKNTKKKGGTKNSTDKKRTSSPQNSHNNKSKNQHLPPWQVMSEGDVKTNIETEKQRREGIRSGQIESSVTSSTEKIGDVTASSSLITPTDRQLFNWKRFNHDKDVSGMKFTGAYLGKQLPPQMGCPEVAFLGRSNVGKSSLLNKLVKRVSDGGGSGSNDSARVGKTPGATASVNIYGIEGKNKKTPLMGFADLPGFGYAKLSKDVKESVEMAAERYLGKRRELALGILLVDIRRVPSDDDRAVLAALYDMGVPLLVVATKVDKIRSKNSLAPALEEVRMGLGLPEGQPFCVSSLTGEGVKQLWSIIMDACEDKVYSLREELEGRREEHERDPDIDDTIMLDDEGNWIEEDEPTAEGLEWARNFAYYDDSNDGKSDGYEPSEASKMKMRENEANQAAANEAMKLKQLRKAARQMERNGEL